MPPVGVIIGANGGTDGGGSRGPARARLRRRVRRLAARARPRRLRSGAVASARRPAAPRRRCRRRRRPRARFPTNAPEPATGLSRLAAPAREALVGTAGLPPAGSCRRACQGAPRVRPRGGPLVPAYDGGALPGARPAHPREAEAKARPRGRGRRLRALRPRARLRCGRAPVSLRPRRRRPDAGRRWARVAQAIPELEREGVLPPALAARLTSASRAGSSSPSAPAARPPLRRRPAGDGRRVGAGRGEPRAPGTGHHRSGARRGRGGLLHLGRAAGGALHLGPGQEPLSASTTSCCSGSCCSPPPTWPTWSQVHAARRRLAPGTCWWSRSSPSSPPSAATRAPRCRWPTTSFAAWQRLDHAALERELWRSLRAATRVNSMVCGALRRPRHHSPPVGRSKAHFEPVATYLGWVLLLGAVLVRVLGDRRDTEVSWSAILTATGAALAWLSARARALPLFAIAVLAAYAGLSGLVLIAVRNRVTPGSPSGSWSRRSGSSRSSWPCTRRMAEPA